MGRLMLFDLPLNLTLLAVRVFGYESENLGLRRIPTESVSHRFFRQGQIGQCLFKPLFERFTFLAPHSCPLSLHRA